MCRDYPRVGGEETHRATRSRRDLGLPPRGRGRGQPVEPVETPAEITPAWAGKRWGAGSLLVCVKDYPRVGGEEFLRAEDMVATIGLPPRGRGRAQPSKARLLIHRITPAWAGKSVARYGDAFGHWDYPRVGGEEKVIVHLGALQKGLPPRGRGRDWRTSKLVRNLGITPAWAGKSDCVRFG